jgi:hypothetical protein
VLEFGGFVFLRRKLWIMHTYGCLKSLASCIREHEIADVTKKPEFTPFYWKFSLFVFVSEKNIAFLFSLLFVE